MTRPARNPLLVAALVCAAWVAEVPLAAQDGTGPDRFERLAERYFDIVEARPRRARAFELLYRHYASAGRLEELRKLVAARVTASPESAALRVIDGLVSERMRETQRAAKAFARAHERAPTDWYPCFLLGTLDATRLRHQSAAAWFQKALERDPPRVELLPLARHLVQSLSRSGHGESAIAVLDDVLDRLPSDPEILADVARLVSEHGTFEQAMARWRAVLDAAGDDRDAAVRARMEMASLLRAAGRHDAAVKTLESLLDELEPRHWLAKDVRSRIEEVFVARGDPKGLLAFHARRLDAHPQDIESMLGVAVELSRMGDHVSALDRFRAALALAPRRRDLNEALIDAWAKAGDARRALQQARHLTELFEGDRGAWERRFVAELELGSAAGEPDPPAQALSVLRTMADLAPAGAPAALTAAELARDRARQLAPGDGESRAIAERLRDGAEAFYREALERSSGSPDCCEQLAAFLIERGRREAAREVLARMVLPPNDRPADFARQSLLYQRHGFLERAVQAARKSLGQGDGDFEVLHRIIDLELARGRAEAARAWLARLEAAAGSSEQQERALRDHVEVHAYLRTLKGEAERLRRRIDRDDPPALRDLWLLGLVQARRGRPASARGPLELAVRRDAGNVRLRATLAAILEVSGDLPGAIRQLKKLAIDDRRRATRHTERIVELFRRMGSDDQALAAVDRMLERNPAWPRGWRLKAELLEARGEDSEVAGILQQAVALSPRDADARLMLARALARAGQRRSALEQYWKLLEGADGLEAALATLREIAALTPDMDGQARALRRIELIARRHSMGAMIRVARVGYLSCCQRILALDGALRTIAQGAPRDPEHLEFLVQVARKREIWGVAARLQERLVAIRPSPAGLRELGSLKTRSGDPAGARAAFRRLLGEGSGLRLLRSEITARLRAGSFQVVTDLARMLLEQRPDQHSVRLKLVIALHSLGRAEEARKHLELLMDLEDARQGGTTGVTAVRLGGRVILRHGSNADRQRVLALPEIRGLSREQVLWVQWRKALKAWVEGKGDLGRIPPAGLADSGPGMRFVAGLLSAAHARRAGEGRAWSRRMLSRPGTRPETLRSMALAAAAVGLRDSELRICRRWSEKARGAVLPRMLPFILPFVSPLKSRQAGRQQHDLEGRVLERAYSWLLQNHPRRAVFVLRDYMGRLVRIGRTAMVTRHVQDAISSAADLRGVARLMPLVDLVANRHVRERLLARAAQLAQGAAGTEDARALLDLLLWMPIERTSPTGLAARLKLLAECVPCAHAHLPLRWHKLPGGVTYPARGVPRPTGSPLASWCLTPDLDFSLLCVLRRTYAICVRSDAEATLNSFLQERLATANGGARNAWVFAAWSVRGWKGGAEAIEASAPAAGSTIGAADWVTLVKARALLELGRAREALAGLAAMGAGDLRNKGRDRALRERCLANLARSGSEAAEEALVLSIKRQGGPRLEPFFRGYLHAPWREPRRERRPGAAQRRPLAISLPSLLDQICARGHGERIWEPLRLATMKQPQDPLLATLSALVAIKRGDPQGRAWADNWLERVESRQPPVSCEVMSWVVAALQARPDLAADGQRVGFRLLESRKIRWNLRQRRALVRVLAGAARGAGDRARLKALLGWLVQGSGVLKTVSRARQDTDAVSVLRELAYWSASFPPELQLDVLQSATLVFTTRIGFARAPWVIVARYREVLTRVASRLPVNRVETAALLVEKVVFPKGLTGLPVIHPATRKARQHENLAAAFVTLAVRVKNGQRWIESLESHPRSDHPDVRRLLAMFTAMRAARVPGGR